MLILPYQRSVGILSYHVIAIDKPFFIKEKLGQVRVSYIVLRCKVNYIK